MIPRSLVAAGLALVATAGLVSTAQARAPLALAQDDKAKDKSKEDVLKSIQEDAQAGNMDGAISKIESALKDSPKDQQLLFGLMMLTQQKGQSMMADRKASIPVFLKSAEAAKKLQTSLGKNIAPQQGAYLGMVLYNGACSLALDNKPEAAIKMLADAFDVGFSEFGTFEKDEELNSLRKRDDFAKLVKSLDAKKAEIAKKEAEAEAKLAEEAKAEVPKMLKENKSFPFTFSLKDLDDKKIALDDFKGKVVIVDIWGTWCPPCRKEIPHFVDLHKKYNGKGLEIVGLNYNEEGDAAEVKKTIKDFIAENKMPYKCAVGDEKTQEMVPDFQGFPTTLFIDRAGKVRLKLVGYTEKPVLEEIVKTLLEEK